MATGSTLSLIMASLRYATLFGTKTLGSLGKLGLKRKDVVILREI